MLFFKNQAMPRREMGQERWGYGQENEIEVEKVGSAGVELEPSWEARSTGPDSSEQFWAFKTARSI